MAYNWRKMASPEERGTTRMGVRFSNRIASYLDELAQLGVHGTTGPEVARKLVENEIERLIRDGFLKLPEGR
jgi:hypothetical protein